VVRLKLFRPKMAALAVRSSTASTRALSVVNGTAGAAARRLKPSSNSGRPSRRQTTTGAICP
jgi:hypothetical protein